MQKPTMTLLKLIHMHEVDTSTGYKVQKTITFLGRDPEIIKNIHLDYIEAGSDYITINNYAVTQPILARNKISDQLEDLTLRSVELAKDAVKESGKNTQIAGSLPPLETSYRADLILPENQMLDYYCELVDILENEVDIIICETMSSSSEARCALSLSLIHI